MTFLPKYIEHQFNVNNSMANIYTGGVAIPGAVVGIVFGGYLVKQFKIDPKGASKMAIICNILCCIGIFCLIFLGCQNVKMVGINVSYTKQQTDLSSSSSSSIDSYNLTSTCNKDCECSTNFIEPICGRNGLTYFSPCFAGCSRFKSNNITIYQQNKYSYSSCSCITDENEINNNDYVPVAQSGICSSNCNTLAPFLILLFIITLLTSLNQMPMLMVTLRSVTEIERPFALGLQLVILRLLAYIPSPLIFGRSIDWTCLVWRKDECDQTGSCLFYDREKFRHVYGTIGFVYKFVSLLLFVFLYLSVRKYSEKNNSSSNINNEEVNGIKRNSLDKEKNNDSN